MLKRLVFRQKFRCFEEGFTVEFRPGVNLIVGDQGSGKTTLFHAIRTRSRGDTNAQKEKSLVELEIERKGEEGIRVHAFDFEKDNPRLASRIPDKASLMVFQINSKRMSHGESVNKILADLKGSKPPFVALLDEPDAALSPRSILALGSMLREIGRKPGAQVLVSAHNPWLIKTFEEVYSVEHRKWMRGCDFLEKHQLAALRDIK